MKRTPVRKNGKQSKIIIAVVVMFIVLCVILGIAALGFGIFNNKPQTSDASNTVFRDFYLNEYNILAGQKKEVLFQAEIETDTPVNDTSILVCSNHGKIGFLHDDGLNGDEVAGDSIFSGLFELYHRKVESVNYWASCGSQSSEKKEIMFYREFTDRELDDYCTLTEELSDITKNYIDKEGCVNPEDVDTLFDEVENHLRMVKREKGITEYKRNDTNILVLFKSKIRYMFCPEINGVLSGGGALRILTFEPSEKSFAVFFSRQLARLDSLASTNGNKGSHKVSESAVSVEKATKKLNYYKKDRYTNEQVTLDSLKKLDNTGLLIFEGHGNYSTETGSVLATSEAATREKLNNKNYTGDIQAGRVIISSGLLKLNLIGKKLCVTASFFDTYLNGKNIDGAFIYLGACSSGKDKGLADAFLKHNANGVLVFSDTVSMMYEMRIRTYLFQHLSSKDENGLYPSIQSAYETTVRRCKGYDPYMKEKAMPILYTRDDYFPTDILKDYYLIKNPPESEISGTIVDAKTKEPIEGAKISCKALNVSSITDNSGIFRMKLRTEETTLKFTITHKNYYTKTKEVTIQPSTDLSMELKSKIISSEELRDLLVNHTWESNIQCPEEYTFNRDNTGVANDFANLTHFAYSVKDNKLIIKWDSEQISEGAESVLEYVTKKSDVDFKKESFFYNTAYQEIGEDEGFFYQTSWEPDEMGLGNAFWIRMKKGSNNETIEEQLPSIETTVNNKKESNGIVDSYLNVISENEYGEYTIYDINKDGTPELIIEIPYRYRKAYTYDQNLIDLGEIGSPHSIMYEIDGKNGMYDQLIWMGNERTSVYTLIGNQLNQEIIVDRIINEDDATKLDYPISMTPISDDSLVRAIKD